MTQFEKAVQAAEAGQLDVPKVIYEGKEIPYFGYQLAVHKFDLSILAMGMKKRGVKFSNLKAYYGLKGRSAKACLPEMDAIIKAHKEKVGKN